MIIVRTPLRIAFFGGGTDHPAWSNENPGAAISATIDKHIYLQMRKLPDAFDFKYRIAWKKLEECKTVDEIQHPVIKAVLENQISNPQALEVLYSADLPARSGLGSSSAFTVGFIKGLRQLNGAPELSPEYYAEAAVDIEQNVLHESVGCQDQYAAAYGGFNRMDFYKKQIILRPLEGAIELSAHCMLFFTGLQRNASEIEKEKVSNFKNKKEDMQQLYRITKSAYEILNSSYPDIMPVIGKLLDETWRIKRTLCDGISNPFIDEAYDAAMRAGAYGGKLVGAGGGGFLLFLAAPDKQRDVRSALSKLKEVPFKFEPEGSKTIYKDDK